MLEFAGRKKICFGGSVLLAILGVAASFIPYLLTANVVGQLIAGNRDWSYYLQMMLFMALCWVIRITLHTLSTSLSHIGTFNVLGGIRKQLCEKLSRIPLGSVLDDNSGSYKNIIVERVDSMETTLAHIVNQPLHIVAQTTSISHDFVGIHALDSDICFIDRNTPHQFLIHERWVGELLVVFVQP